MTEELDTLRRVVGKLEEGGFNYMLTGSMAMGFYSIPRMTRDSDIVIVLSDKDIRKFVRLFEEDFYVDEYMVRESWNSKLMFNIFDKKSLFKIDFIIMQNETYEVLKFERKRRFAFEGFEINVISIEGLIVSKLLWARNSESEKQLNDVRNLLKYMTEKDYLLKTIKDLDLDDMYKKISLADE
ncbi:MAG: hypothetical protein IPG02_14640 [Ignavibacteria bacterium]|nr:hypothetical protein [Ignavibacteria bacterium]